MPRRRYGGSTRTAADWLTDGEMQKLTFEEVRGVAPIKEAIYKIGDLELRVAVTSGLANARKVLESIKSGEKHYDFIEIMGCPGGCVNGGGQPVQPAEVRNFVDLRALRAAGLYADDASKAMRKSHENPGIQQLYKEFFGEPGSHLAHEVLHTHYKERSRF